MTAIIIPSFHWAQSLVLFRSLFYKGGCDSAFSRARVGRNNRRILCFFFSDCRRWKAIAQSARSPGAVSDFWDVDLVQPRLRRRVAHRSRVRATRRRGRSLFCSGSSLPIAWRRLFAVAFGNRTELILTLPIYFYYLWLPSGGDGRPAVFKQVLPRLPEKLPAAVQFSIIPVALALLTAVYNFERFQSAFEFGYNRIPSVLQEPWYQHGLFSLRAIPWNAYKMLFEGFSDIPVFPFIRPNAFGCSIFLSSPFLFLLFREGGRYKITAWVAIGLLALVLRSHENPGGWQFSYRYAIILLPWMFLLLVGNGPANISWTEVSLFIVSVAINAIAMCQFLWTNEIHP